MTKKLPKKLQNLLDKEIDPAFAQRAEFILSVIDDSQSKKILDVGCGRGFYIYALTSFKKVNQIRGVDAEEKYINKARKIQDQRVKIDLGSVYSLPYKNNYFDAIVLSEVLEHLVDEKSALSEIRRVLKPKGKLLVSVPNENFPFLWDPINFVLMKFFHTHVDKNIWWAAGIWAGHERLYKENQLFNLLNRNGFEIERTERIVSYSWPFSHFLLYGIGKNFVEIFGSDFNRFSFKKSRGANLLASIIRLPTSLKKNIKSEDFYVDLAIAAKKA